MQNLVEWSDELSVGIDEIDAQHKKLVGMLNELIMAVDGGWGKEARNDVIDKLIEYTKVHFATEESLMSTSKYPGVKKHKEMHAELIRMVKAQIQQYDSNPNASSYHLIFFLKKWLVKHIMHDDQQFGNYFVKSVAPGTNKMGWFKRLFSH